MNFIKKNKFIIMLIGAILAMALIINPIIDAFDTLDVIYRNPDYFSNEAKGAAIATIASYICIGLSALFFILMSYKKSFNRSFMISIIILYFGADIVYIAFQFINDGNAFSLIYSVIIDVLLIIFMIFSLNNKNYFLTAFTIALIDAAFALLGVFNGSQVSFSQFIIDVLLIESIYLYVPDDSEYNYYS